HQRESAPGPGGARPPGRGALRRGPRRVRQGGHRRTARAPPPYAPVRRHRRDAADRPRSGGAPAQGVGRGRRAHGEDERGRDRGAGRAAGAHAGMSTPSPAPAFGRFFLPGPTDVHPDGLAAAAREFDDVLVLVDAVTYLAGSPVETDAWGLDFMFTGSQKALALPPGLALGVASERMLDRAKTLESRGLYFDLPSFQQATAKFQPTNTPAISLLYALDHQLERIAAEGGAGGRWRRHDAMRRRVEQWSEECGVAFLPRADRRSWTVSCLKLPEGKSAKQVVGALQQQGWVIGSGYGALKDSTIRIGHMGDHTVEALDH